VKHYFKRESESEGETNPSSQEDKTKYLKREKRGGGGFFFFLAGIKEETDRENQT